MKWPSPRKPPHAAAAPTKELAESVARANACQRDGKLAAAEALYEEVLRSDPAQVDALHYLGVLRSRQKRDDEAVALIEKALALDPAYVDAHNNLGNIHKLANRLDKAGDCYARVLTLAPGHAGALNNLAVVLEAQQRTADAREIHRWLAGKYPDAVDIRYRCGEFLCRNSETYADVDFALECLRFVLAREPRHTSARQRLGMMLYMLKRRDDAAAVYREWLVLEPDHPVAKHLLAASGGLAAPPRADDRYVRDTFDSFAASFDRQLVENLGYVAPQRLHAALAAVLDAPAGNLDVLDAGCGTGLCGPLFRPYAARLVGVDLSQGMIDRAATRGYDRLEVAELTAYLRAADTGWDVILSADTLVYFGDLDEVLKAAGGALRSGGLLGFTLEALPGDEDHALLSLSGRYEHSRSHVERCLAQAGCTVVSFGGESLRKENGRPVAGWVVVARRNAAQA